MGITTKRRRSNINGSNIDKGMHGDTIINENLHDGSPQLPAQIEDSIKPSTPLPFHENTAPGVKKVESRAWEHILISYDEQILHPFHEHQPKPLPADVLKKAPFFYYNDYSQEQDLDDQEMLVPAGWAGNFPLKLHAILLREDLKSVATWLHHGRSFRITNPRGFEASAVTKYFSHGKFSLFVRQLKTWGFRRITSPGPDRNSYYHELFLRGMPHLTKRMKIPENLMEIPSNHEPRFAAINVIYPVPEKTREEDKQVLLSQSLVYNSNKAEAELFSTQQNDTKQLLLGFLNDTSEMLSDDVVENLVEKPLPKRAKILLDNCQSIDGQMLDKSISDSVACTSKSEIIVKIKPKGVSELPPQGQIYADASDRYGTTESDFAKAGDSAKNHEPKEDHRLDHFLKNQRKCVDHNTEPIAGAVSSCDDSKVNEQGIAHDMIYAHNLISPIAWKDSLKDSSAFSFEESKFPIQESISTDSSWILDILKQKNPSEILETIIMPLAGRLNAAEDTIRIQEEKICQLQILLLESLGVKKP